MLIPELGLYHYRARTYSAYLGRFLQADPAGYADGLNLYAYVGNDPINATDPSGLGAIYCRPNHTLTQTYNGVAVTNAKTGEVFFDGGWDITHNVTQLICDYVAEGIGGSFPGNSTPPPPEKEKTQKVKQESVACPVGQPAVITAPFGELRGSSIHTGVDLRARMGAPIFAPFQGTVRSVFSGGRGGDSILIANADGSVSGFAHTGAVAGLSSGQTVQVGQQIGVSNGSGTGAPHLHLTHRATANSPKSDPLATAIGGACNAAPK